MATVSGFNKARMLQIEKETVVAGRVVGDNLVLTTRDGEDILAGNVRGSDGNDGSPGPGLTFVGRDRQTVLRNGVTFADGSQNGDAGTWALGAVPRVTATLANISASANGWASGNQDCEWFLEVQINGGSWVVLDQVYRQNNGYPSNNLGFSVHGWFPFATGAAINVRVRVNVAGGGSGVIIGGTAISANYFR